MKHTLTLFFIFIAIASLSQKSETFDLLRARSVFRPPAYNSLSNAAAAGSQPGNLVYVHTGTDTGVYVRSWDNTRWLKVSGFSSGGGGYTAGNGIKIDGTTITWADTLSTNVTVIQPSFSQIKFRSFGTPSNYSEFGNSYGGAYMANFDPSGVEIAKVTPFSMISKQPVTIGYNYLSKFGYTNMSDVHTNIRHTDSIIIFTGSANFDPTIALNLDNITMLSGSNGIGIKPYGQGIFFSGDSIFLRKNPYVYSPSTASTAKYKALLMDSVTGALVTTAPENLGGAIAGKGLNFADGKINLGGTMSEYTALYLPDDPLEEGHSFVISNFSGNNSFNFSHNLMYLGATSSTGYARHVSLDSTRATLGGIDPVGASYFIADTDGRAGIQGDSIYLKGSTGTVGYVDGASVYAPTNTSIDKYAIVAMDKTTGAIVNLTKELVRRVKFGTPSGTADSQGEEGDEMYDANYRYIKTSAGWRRIAYLATW